MAGKGQNKSMSKALATKHVAAIALGIGLILALSFAFATPAKAQSIADIQAQIQLLLAQIASMQGGTGQQSGGVSCSFTFTRNHSQGDSGGEVMSIQRFLNSVDGTQLATSGAGSPGNETSFFGGLTRAAVVQFQNKYASEILAPVGLSAGTGYWGPSSRAKANALCAAGPGPIVPGPIVPGPITGSVNVTAGIQPANALAVEGASRIPFTTFAITNNSSAAVVISNVTVQKTGFGDKAVFDGVVLVDSNGTQYGNSKTLNSNNQAVLDAGFTLQPGQSIMLTVAGNMLVGTTALDAYAGQVLGISVVGVSTSAPVAGSLPINGAQHTINSTLSIGAMTVAVGADDPNTTALNYSTAGKAIGTTGFTFASVRATN